VSRQEQLEASLTEALQAATQPFTGPVHLTIPMDVQTGEVGQQHIVPILAPGSSAANEARNDEAAAALATSRAPVVVAGSGVYYARSGARMLAFCERHRLPVTTPIWDRGVVDSPSSVFVGVTGAASGGPAVLGNADCILMSGAQVDYRSGYLQPPAVRADARIVDVGQAWNALDDACQASCIFPFGDWLMHCVSLRDRFRDDVASRGQEQARAGLHAVHIIRAIESVLPLNPVLLIDGGSIGQSAHQLLCSDRYPGDWLTCGRSGVVGWGLGGAMAARLAFPNRPIILLSGDGAFTFNVADLESAARQHLGFVALVADDQGWSITRTGHVRQFGAPIASSLGFIACDQLASALGARGVRASTPEEIGQHLRTGLEDPGVTVIHVPIVGGNPA
jgi:acetolactate synthase-1/2/3 large subunit